MLFFQSGVHVVHVVLSVKFRITHDAYSGDEIVGEVVRCGLIYYKTFAEYEKAFDLKEEELLKGLWPAIGSYVVHVISPAISDEGLSSRRLPCHSTFWLLKACALLGML